LDGCGVGALREVVLGLHGVEQGVGLTTSHSDSISRATSKKLVQCELKVSNRPTPDIQHHKKTATEGTIIAPIEMG